MTKPAFDVMFDPWIPVADFDGKRYSLGMLETLKQAHHLQEISDASPMVEFGLYRLLSVLLIDCYRPKKVQDLRNLLRWGHFPEEELLAYRDRCMQEGASFNLFDQQRPFLQMPYAEQWDREQKPVSAINEMIPHGNNHTHFDHRGIDGLSFSYGEAARHLVPLQLFSTPGAQSYPSSINGAPPYYALVRRDSLFETLVFAMVPEERLPNHIGFDRDAAGNFIPVRWRSASPVEPEREVAETSFLDGMLFPARRILLIPPEDGAGVKQAYISQGMNFVVKASWTDPSAAYKNTDKGRASLKPDSNTPVWKNVGSLIDISNRTAPLLLGIAEDLDRDALSYDLMLYGVQTSKASYLDAAKFDLRIPAALLEDEEKIGVIQKNIQLAEGVASQIKRAFRDKNGCTVPGMSMETVTELLDRLSIAEEAELWKCCDRLSRKDCNLPEIQRQWASFLVDRTKEELRRMEQSVNLRGPSVATLIRQEEKILRGIQIMIERELGQ